MPRKPLGTYTRDTASWYQHRRARACGRCQIVNGEEPAIGLHNDDQLGRVCHVLGVSISVYMTPAYFPFPMLASGYYSTPFAALDVANTVAVSPVESFFDQEGPPMVSVDIGIGGIVFPATALMIPTAPIEFSSDPTFPSQQYTTATIHYPPGGIAAFKPTRGFFISFPNTDFLDVGVSFDFVMLPD